MTDSQNMNVAHASFWIIMLLAIAYFAAQHGTAGIGLGVIAGLAFGWIPGIIIRLAGGFGDSHDPCPGAQDPHDMFDNDGS